MREIDHQAFPFVILLSETYQYYVLYLSFYDLLLLIA